MKQNNVSPHFLRRVKWLAFGATALAITALEVYYFMRGVPLGDDIIDWLLGMSIAFVILSLTFWHVERIQARLRQKITRHRQTADDLRRRMALEKLIAGISTHFINLPLEKVNEGIQQALQQIGRFTAVDRSYVFLFSSDMTTMDNTHEWCAPGIEPQIDNLQHLPADTFPWWMDKLHRLETIHIPRVSDLPPEAAAEKEILQAQDIQSLIVLPLVFMERLTGFIGFDAVRAEKEWPDEITLLLRTTANAIAGVLERKRVEAALLRSRREYEELVNTAEGIVWEAAPSPFRFSFVSRHAERLLGYPPYRWYTEPDFWENHIHPDDRERAVNFCRRAIERGENHVFEYRMLTAGGGVVWLRDIVSVVTKNGRPVKLRGIMVDITARVQAEQALKQNEKRFRLLYEQAPLAYQTLDEAGHLIEVNQAWLDLLGYSRPDVIGRSFGDFLTPPSVDLFTKRFPRFKATGRVRSARFQMVRRDGTGVTVSLDGSIGYDRTGNFKQTHCILHNITELEQMADALRESDERLYSIIRSMDDLLFVLDENGVFVDYYQKDQEHDLYAPPEIFLGKSYRDVLPPHVVKLMEPAVRAVRAAVSVQEFDYYLDMPGRGRQWYNARLSPRKDRRGQFAGITVVARNVTDRVLAEQTIKESEARFRSLVDSMDERIFLLDRDHRITGVFGGWLEKFQIDPQVFTGKTLDEIFEPDMARLQIEAQKKALAGEHTVFDWTLAGTPAGTLHFRGSVSPLRNAQGEITGTVSVGHDITDRVLVEQAEREQRRLAETLRDVTLALAARIETGAVLDEILQQARRLVDYSTANIMLLQQDTLRVVRHRGYETFGGADVMEGLTIPLQTFPLNVEAARTRRPVLVPDTAEEPRWVQFPGTEWIKTCLMLPLVHGERVLGFLNFDADTPGAFSPADAERLQPLAAAAAVALNNARLLAETGKRAGQMALVHTLTRQITPLLDVGSLLRTAVEALQTRFGYLSVQMYILDHEAGELEARAVAGKAGLVEPGYRQKVGQGITGRAAARGEQVLVPDVSAEPGFIACVPGIRSELVLPVWCAGQLAGVLNIESDRLNGFDEADIVALEALAGQLGAVLENARLFTETNRRAAQLEALRQIGLEISAQLELNRVLESIVRRAIELLNGSSGGMCLYRPRQDALEWAVSIGENLAPTGTLLRRGEGVSGKVLATNAPLVVDDYHHWEGRAEIYAGYPFTSVVGVPVRWGEEFLGVLDVLADGVGVFSEDDVALLNLLAAQAAVAVHNARLYEQARRDAETKATLLQEVNHRVKNNLATIIGLLYTERNRAELKDNPAFQDVIHNLSNRVRGLATVHTMLSASGWQPLQLGKLVEQVARAALRATPPGKYAAVTVSPVKIAIPPGQANNLAIVINELATNSVKHTCEEQNIIQITVNLQQTGDLVELEFRDDGPGYPDRVLRSNYKNVGLYLIQNIVEEGLNGTLALSNDGGAVTNITFKLDAPEE